MELTAGFSGPKDLKTQHRSGRTGVFNSSCATATVAVMRVPSAFQSRPADNGRTQPTGARIKWHCADESGHDQINLCPRQTTSRERTSEQSLSAFETTHSAPFVTAIRLKYNSKSTRLFPMMTRRPRRSRITSCSVKSTTGRPTRTGRRWPCEQKLSGQLGRNPRAGDRDFQQQMRLLSSVERTA